MNSSRKHATAGTQCPDSRPGRARKDSRRRPLAAALPAFLLAAALGLTAAATRAQTAGPGGANAPAPAPRTVAAAEAGPEISVPVRFHYAGTRQRPVVIATIGDFPTALGDAGKEFLRREFFEHFINDTLHLGDPDSRASLKVTLLPQSSGNEQRSSFTLDDLEGEMSVVVMERRVLVFCSIKLAGAQGPFNLASAPLAFNLNARAA